MLTFTLYVVRRWIQQHNNTRTRHTHTTQKKRGVGYIFSKGITRTHCCCWDMGAERASVALYSGRQLGAFWATTKLSCTVCSLLYLSSLSLLVVSVVRERLLNHQAQLSLYCVEFAAGRIERETEQHSTHLPSSAN